MCSPTRASLLTGRNHTFVGNGQISAIANDFDGFSGIVPKSSAMVAEVLKDYGYNTGAWGKWHNTPEDQITSKGPFDYWPTGYGFEYFYGFLAGRGLAVRTDLDTQHHPGDRREAEGLSPHRGHREGRHPMASRTERLRAGQALLHVLGPGAAHGPHQIFKEWADKYKGKFDDGWDKYRERTFARRRVWAGFRQTPN